MPLKIADSRSPARIATPALAEGFRILPGYLLKAAQAALVAELREAFVRAPFFRPAMPRTGRPFSVEMTNLGTLGWVSDKERGYRYTPRLHIDLYGDTRGT